MPGEKLHFLQATVKTVKVTHPRKIHPSLHRGLMAIFEVSPQSKPCSTASPALIETGKTRVTLFPKVGVAFCAAKHIKKHLPALRLQ